MYQTRLNTEIERVVHCNKRHQPFETQYHKKHYSKCQKDPRAWCPLSHIKSENKWTMNFAEGLGKLRATPVLVTVHTSQLRCIYKPGNTIWSVNELVGLSNNDFVWTYLALYATRVKTEDYLSRIKETYLANSWNAKIILNRKGLYLFNSVNSGLRQIDCTHFINGIPKLNKDSPRSDSDL